MSESKGGNGSGDTAEVYLFCRWIWLCPYCKAVHWEWNQDESGISICKECHEWVRIVGVESPQE